MVKENGHLDKENWNTCYVLKAEHVNVILTDRFQHFWKIQRMKF